jgi:hypothetical protein
MEVVSFYNMFFDAPQPRHHVHVHEPAVPLWRRARVVARARSASGSTRWATPRRADPSGTRRGACAYAPMIRIDDTYHEDLDAAKAKSLLDALA